MLWRDDEGGWSVYGMVRKELQTITRPIRLKCLLLNSNCKLRLIITFNSQLQFRNPKNHNLVLLSTLQYSTIRLLETLFLTHPLGCAISYQKLNCTFQFLTESEFTCSLNYEFTVDDWKSRSILYLDDSVPPRKTFQSEMKLVTSIMNKIIPEKSIEYTKSRVKPGKYHREWKYK